MSIASYVEQQKEKEAALRKLADSLNLPLASTVTENVDGTATIAMPSQAPRKYKLWRRISVEERQDLIAQGLNPDDNPELFAPSPRLGIDLRDATEKIDAFREKYKRLPTGVTLWNAPAPSNCQLPKAKLDADAIAALLKTIAESDAIPAFDPTVMSGILKKFVDVATKGTTLAPQFVYQIAKTVMGLKMAGRVKFENLDVEPRRYSSLIGETGSGKGEAWRRVHKILSSAIDMGGVVGGIKVINSADSGAGIRDVFFEAPEDAGVMLYIDEIESFGNKASATRNPALLDMVIELADSTSISRVKASTKGSKSKHKQDARLAAIMCGPDGLSYMGAFAGKTRQGLWDRFSPEFGLAQETGDLPPIAAEDALTLLIELNQLDYRGTMTMDEGVKEFLDEFWKGQSEDVRKKARWKKGLMLDAYLIAFSRGTKSVSMEDASAAIRIFLRELVIRRVCFTTEVPDRTGYYLNAIKKVTKEMLFKLNAGMPKEQVALSRRDYEKRTNATRDNEEHQFDRAWQIHARTHLMPFKVTKSNGHVYDKFLPIPEEE